jgi:hypothetical protein
MTRQVEEGNMKGWVPKDKFKEFVSFKRVGGGK